MKSFTLSNNNFAVLNPLTCISSEYVLWEFTLQIVVLVSNLVLIYKLFIPKDCPLYRKALFRGVSSMVTVTTCFSLGTIGYLFSSHYRTLNHHLIRFLSIATNGALLNFYLTLPCMIYHTHKHVKKALGSSLHALGFVRPPTTSSLSLFGMLSSRIIWPQRPLYIHLMLSSGVVYTFVVYFYYCDISIMNNLRGKIDQVEFISL